MSKEKRLVPELRFPEFEGKWEESSVDEIFDYLKTNSLSRAQLANHGTIKNIHYGDIHTKFNIILDLKLEELPYVNSEFDSTNVGSMLKNGDLVLSDASEDLSGVGKSIELINVNGLVVAGLHTLAIRPKNDLFYRGFIGYYFNSYHNHRRLVKMSVGSKVKSISKATLSTTIIYYPTIKEQKKVATFLSLIDKKIELLEKKVELLEEQKRGLLQKIFSQEIRFKKDDGSEFEEWEKTALGNIFKERKKYSSKGLEFPHVSLTKEGVVPKSERYERDFLVRSDDKKYKITYFNDICYNPANLKFGVISRNKFGSAIFSPIYVTFKVDKNFDSEFMEYFITRKDLINKLRRYEEGTVYERMAVKPSDFLAFSFYLPKFEEQKKIANFLSSCVLVIDNTKQKLENTKELKKGLLQKMFV